MTPEASLLHLADGTRLAMSAADPAAARVIALLAKAGRLSTARSSPDARHLVAAVEGSISEWADALCHLEPEGTQRCRSLVDATTNVRLLRSVPASEEQWLWQQLLRLSTCIGRETHARGGVLIHSGLAARVGAGHQGGRAELQHGVLLAGRSGVGKSTASRRLPAPWCALADDVTLVVRAADGCYWAHPWPTWSRFFGPEAGDGTDSWDVERAVPVRAIFVLEQGSADRAEPLGQGHAVALLAELARQTSASVLTGWPIDEIVAFNLGRFANLCALVRAVPAYLLHVSLGGSFWEEIERVLDVVGR